MYVAVWMWYVVKSAVCALHHSAPVAHTDILELCHELQGTSATVLYSKLSVSLVTNVAASRRTHVINLAALFCTRCSLPTWYSALQKSSLEIWMTEWFGEWQWVLNVVWFREYFSTRNRMTGKLFQFGSPCWEDCKKLCRYFFQMVLVVY